MSQALYRKYRSKSLADVVGQSHITDILTRALAANRIAHAYLFTGPRGVGKTSIARILAHEINQLPYTDESTHLDIIEIDAASNNGVDDVRDLREKVQIAPALASKKIYIIDEVHMLSKQAFNALLKTLEEPPAHVVFILATTDVDKLPATIISRTQRYAFRAISPADAINHLKNIAKQEKIDIDDDAIELIAERGDGSFRDSISLLDQLASLSGEKSKITVSQIENTLGLAPSATVDSILTAVEKHDIATIAKVLATTESEGVSPAVLAGQITRALRSRILTKPQLVHLLDSILDVPRASNPSVKLLTVLGSASLEHKPRSAALATPVLEVSATIEELSHQATKAHPVAPAPSPAAAPHTPPTAPSKPAPSKPVPTKSAPPTPTKPAQSSKKAAPHGANEADSTPEVQISPEASPTEIDWQPLLNYTKDHYIALYSVLSKCDYVVEDGKFIIYSVNPFYKKKLDDPKYNTYLYNSLKQTGGYDLEVETIPTRAPMKDSQAAAIADIMGGGVEVALDAS